MTLIRTRPLLTVAAVCLGGTLFAGLGGFHLLERAGESPLEFVGNLISNVHHIFLGPARSDVSSLLLKSLWSAK